MLTLLRNPVDNPSYKRGLFLTGAMLCLYSATFLLAAIEPWVREFVASGKLICLALAAFLALRAMSERRVLREQKTNYLSMLDKSILPLSWQIGSVLVGGALAACVYAVLGQAYVQNALHAFAAGAALVLGIAYVFAAKRWHDNGVNPKVRS